MEVYRYVTPTDDTKAYDTRGEWQGSTDSKFLTLSAMLMLPAVYVSIIYIRLPC